jgi:hypothetical protein
MRVRLDPKSAQKDQKPGEYLILHRVSIGTDQQRLATGRSLVIGKETPLLGTSTKLGFIPK